MKIDFYAYLWEIHRSKVHTDGALYNAVQRDIQVPGLSTEQKLERVVQRLAELIAEHPVFGTAPESAQQQMKTLQTILLNTFGIQPPQGFRRVQIIAEEIDKITIAANT